VHYEYDDIEYKTTVWATPGITTLTWNGPDGAHWDSPHWIGGDPEDVPNESNPTIVTGNAVTVAEDASAYSLSIGSDGAVVIPSGRQLSVVQDVQIGEGTVDIAAGGLLAAQGDVTLGGGSLYVCELSEDLCGQITALEPSASVELDDASGLQLQVNAGSPFKATEYVVVRAGDVGGVFGSVGGLGEYVTGDDLVYTDPTQVTVRIPLNLNLGDANLDTKTNVQDFNDWNANKFTDGTKWETGDFTGDRKTNVLDFNVWNEHKFTSATGGARLVEGQVPEPSNVVLLLTGLIVVAVGWWGRRSA
jgi:hypothetical protein